MKISYNWLKDYIKGLPKPEKLAELLTLHSFEVGGMEKIKGDYVFDIDVLPNRAHDSLSHIGIAREIAVITNTKLQVTSYKLQEFNLKVKDFVGVKVKNADLCPRYTARVITDIKVGSSPKWMQERLKSIGQKPINNIVDAANYVMFELGQPLHAFDFDKIESVQNPKTIIIRKAKKGEKITTLDGEKCELDSSTLVIADNKDPIAIAGVKGGKKAEIDKKTKTIILESANFNSLNIRRSSQKLGLKTDASMRFEYGIDSNLASEAIDRLAVLIQKVAGGKIAKRIVDIYPKKIRPKKIKLDPAYLNDLLGINISVKKVISILEKLGCGVKKLLTDRLMVTVPTFRLDLEIEEDLIEEIARIYGYNKISVKPPLAGVLEVRPDDLLKLIRKTKNILEGLGLTETYNYSFIGEGDVEKMGLNARDYLELENPLSSDLQYLRRILITNLLKNIKENFKHFDEVRIFELGKVYSKSRIKEKLMLAGMIAKKREIKSGELFYEGKGIVDSLLNKLRISEGWHDDFKATPEWSPKNIWHSGRVAEIKVGNEEIGFLGEVNPDILAKFNIKGKVVAFNFDFEGLMKLTAEELIYQHPSKYPAVVRDLAVVVSQGDTVEDVLNAIHSAGGPLIRDIDLFDMYEGPQIPRGKKNLAFHIIYQSDERTLTDKEVDEIQNKIVWVLENEKGWEIRK